MTLFFDEDCGTGVARALSLVGYRTQFVGKSGGPRKGTPDEEWLRIAGLAGWLVISCNKKILDTDAELEALIQNRVGCVFLSTGNETSRRLLYLMLRKMDWLERIDQEVERPFAFILTGTGRVTEVNPATLRERSPR